MLMHKLSSLILLALPLTLFCSNASETDPTSALLLGAGAVGTSPQNAGDGQTVATAGQAGSSDLESTQSSSQSSGPQSSPAQSQTIVAAADTTGPRLVRIDWATDCSMTPSGLLRCNPRKTGPELIFDEAIDCNSIPRLNGRTIENGAHIKAYARVTSEYYFILGGVADVYRYSAGFTDQSIAVVGECSGNRVRIHPVADGAPGEFFATGIHTIILTGGVKDLAGNVTPDGDSRFVGPVGDIRDDSEIDSTLSPAPLVSINDMAPSSGLYFVSTGPNAIRAEVSGGSSSVLDLWPAVSSKQDSDGKIRVRIPHYQLDCDNTEEMRKYFSVEFVTWDDFRAKKPYTNSPILSTTCEDFVGQQKIMVIDAPTPTGSLIRVHVQGTLPDKAGQITKGSGSYLTLLQDYNGVVSPIPRTFTYLLWKWPENLAKEPTCVESTVQQIVTHYDQALMGPSSCRNDVVSRGVLAEKAAYYSYDSVGNPVSVSGICAEYSGPGNYENLDWSAIESMCTKKMPGVPAALQPADRYFSTGGCGLGWGASEKGDSYVTTNVAGVCIENPGKPNEIAVTYYNYPDKKTAKAACKGIWREAGLGYAFPRAYNEPSLPPAGTMQTVKAASCPATDTNTGGVGTQLPTGQSCEGRKIEIDTTAGRWFNTPEQKIPHPTKAGKYTVMKGIHTYWQNEPLIVRVKNNCQEGYYKLTFKGMNVSGPLPDFYKGYALTLQRGNEDIAGMVLPASDAVYGSAATVVYLEKGDSEFRLMWRNDAYKEKVYDANLQLNGVTMSFLPTYTPPVKLARTGRDFCAMDGRFFFGSKSAWTDSGSQQISYCFDGLKPGKYEVRLTGRNHGTLPAGYTQFNVDVAGDGVNGSAAIPASAEKSMSGKVVLDLTGRDGSLDLIWTNPAGISPELRAAFELESISLRRIGDSERSQLAAFIGGSASRTTVAVLLLVLLTGVALLLARRKAARSV
jgi:hypothetical protein